MDSARVQLQQVCQTLYEEDPEHVEGGCGDISAAIFLWLKETDPEWPVEVHAGTAILDGRHTHVWLEIAGELFDPIGEATGWNYRKHIRETDPEIEKNIIDLHTDPDIVDEWNESYERELVLLAAKNQPIPKP